MILKYCIDLDVYSGVKMAPLNNSKKSFVDFSRNIY